MSVCKFIPPDNNARIKTLAIDKINIYDNTSVYPDEYLAHRIALIPLRCINKNIDLNKSQIELCVHAAKDIYNVTTKDFRCLDGVTPVINNLIICRLFPGQSLRLSAFVQEGTGDDHAKWSPINNITFKPRKGYYFIEMETHGTVEPKILIDRTLALLNTL